MKPVPSPSGTAAFTLIELIGVMAIIAIIASILAPNVLHTIERAAVRAETANLQAIGEQMKLFLRDNATLPTTALPPATPNWTSQVGVYSSLNATDLLTNRRQMNRLYVPDPVAANQRALLVSSMRNGIALPSAANIAANFTAIWNTADGTVPGTAGWTAWNVDNIEYLVIERVNFASVYRIDLPTYNITLNNQSAVTASYQVTLANGTIQPTINLIAGATTSPALSLRPKDRLALFRAASGVTLDYSYVVSASGKTFDFSGTAWTPQ